MPETRPVLVVDDDPTILQTVSELLEMEGYRVNSAADGVQALEWVRRERPALILLDMRMPLLDGWGVARELAAQGIQVPILVMSAGADTRRWAEEIRAVGYVAKPFEADDLIKMVADHYGGKPGSA